MTQDKNIPVLTPDRIEQLPRAAVLRRFENAAASLAIEGFEFSADERAFFQQMIADGLSEDQMLERIHARHGLELPAVAE